MTKISLVIKDKKGVFVSNVPEKDKSFLKAMQELIKEERRCPNCNEALMITLKQSFCINDSCTGYRKIH